VNEEARERKNKWLPISGPPYSRALRKFFANFAIKSFPPGRHPSLDIPPGTLNNILKQAGLK
jgi:hypothetical protein